VRSKFQRNWGGDTLNLTRDYKKTGKVTVTDTLNLTRDFKTFAFGSWQPTLQNNRKIELKQKLKIPKELFMNVMALLSLTVLGQT
jgi:hypothetical protein